MASTITSHNGFWKNALILSVSSEFDCPAGLSGRRGRYMYGRRGGNTFHRLSCSQVARDNKPESDCQHLHSGTVRVRP